MLTRLAAMAIAATIVTVPISDRTARSQDGGALPSFSADERALLDRGGAVVRVLPAAAPDITISCAIGVRTNADRFLKWAKTMDTYRLGSYVPASGRFSNPPQLSDLAALHLTNADLRELRACDTGDCGLKLSSAEIARLRAAAAGGEGWQARTEQRFREVMLDRARAYLESGAAGMAPYNDRLMPAWPANEFNAIVTPPEFMTYGASELARYLTTYPRHDVRGVESYLYWSIETFGTKPTVLITHVAVVQPAEPWAPEAIVAANTIFASHYLYAGLAVTALVRSAPGHAPDLVYRHHVRADVLDGPFGGWIRRGIYRRVRDEAPGVLAHLRDYLEGNGGSRTFAKHFSQE